MTKKVQIEIDEEILETIKMLQEILPAEDGQTMDENEVLKIVLGTFMAFVQGDEDETEHSWCGCGQGHCH